MKHTFPAVLFGAALLFSATPSNAQRGVGGHAGGGRFGGFSSHGSGHSFGHVFGGHATSRGKGSTRASGSAGQAPLSGEISIHGRIVTLPAPGFHVAPANKFHRPFVEFGFGGPRGFSTFSQGFAFGFCSSFGGFPTRHFLWRDFDCVDGGFFADPFLFGGFFPGLFGLNEVNSATNEPDPDSGDFSGENAPAMESASSESQTLAERQPPSRRPGTAKPITLLQLTDGSMYGLTAYRVEGDSLHYVTDYGASNSIPLDRIDRYKTNRLNAERGVKFFIQAEASQH